MAGGAALLQDGTDVAGKLGVQGSGRGEDAAGCQDQAGGKAEAGQYHSYSWIWMEPGRSEEVGRQSRLVPLPLSQRNAARSHGCHKVEKVSYGFETVSR